jgi:hypothetical protein
MCVGELYWTPPIIALSIKPRPEALSLKVIDNDIDNIYNSLFWKLSIFSHSYIATCEYKLQTPFI